MKRFLVAPKRRQWELGLGLTAVLALVAWASFGPLASAGLLCGILGSGLNVMGWFWLTRLCGDMMQDQAKPTMGILLVLLLFLIKLPILVGLGLLAGQHGGAALPSFLVGLGLVYSALTGWVLVKSQDP